MAGCLDGVKVIDLTHHIAGPYCTKLLAEFGAEVVKIERPGVGDLGRRAGPFLADNANGEKSGLFLYLNMGKKSVTLDLKSVTGRRLLRELVDRADIVVENFSPRVMPAWGLSYADLEKGNPGLIMTSISNFGQSGPYRDFKATSMSLLGLGGFMYQTGDPHREPLNLWGDNALYFAGMAAAVGTMAALHARDGTGFGQHVDISVMEAVIACLDFTLVTYSYLGGTRRRLGNRHPFIHPWTLLPCRDGYISLNVGALHHWESLCHMIGRPDMAEDGRFKLSADRAKHADEIDAALGVWLSQRSKQEIVETAQLWRVPCGSVLTVGELFDDPQYEARQFFVDVEDPITGCQTYPGAPFRMSETPWRCGRAPFLGEHNSVILCERLGYTKQDLIRLRECGVI